MVKSIFTRDNTLKGKCTDMENNKMEISITKVFSNVAGGMAMELAIMAKLLLKLIGRIKRAIIGALIFFKMALSSHNIKRMALLKLSCSESDLLITLNSIL